MYWSHNFLAVVFKKQEISHQVVTRMQDLASEFSKIFRGGGMIPPDPHSGTPAPDTQPGLSLFGPKPWSPQLFSRGWAPWSRYT